MSKYYREYYVKNAEHICALHRKYYWQNKERINAFFQKKNNGEEISYEEHEVVERLINQNFQRSLLNSQRCLSRYAYDAINRIKQSHQRNVELYFIKYPFDNFGEPLLRKQLKRLNIFKNREEYQDCYDAGMLAYLYSIHRCAAMNCDYVVQYIQKMMRLYIRCALIVYHDAHNICRINNLKETRI